MFDKATKWFATETEAAEWYDDMARKFRAVTHGKDEDGVINYVNFPSHDEQAYVVEKGNFIMRFGELIPLELLFFLIIA